MANCRLCSSDTKLVDAHIIPRAFYNLTSADEPPARVISNTKAWHPKRVRIGFYDPSILCKACDGQLGRLDQHAAETLLPGGNAFRLSPRGEPICYQYDAADPVLIHQFIASVCWRASISDHYFFARVRLGPYEQQIAQLLRNPDRSMGTNIECVLGEFDDRDVPPLDPHQIRMGGCRYWVLYASRFIFYFKADKRPSSETMAEFALRPGGPVRAIARNWHSSKERALMARIAGRFPNLFQRSS